MNQIKVNDLTEKSNYYPPKIVNHQEVKLAVEQLDKTVKEILAKTGMTEDELANIFDLTKPFPDYATDN